MQSTSSPPASSPQRSDSSPPGPSREALIRDMYALASHLLRSSNLGTFNAVAELDLSFTQIKALCAMDLDESEPSVKGLAESMKVSLPTMSRAIDGLYVRGFVDRCEDREDRRMKRIRLTETGRMVTRTLNASRLIGMREFLTSLNEAGAQALQGALALILADHPEIAALRDRAAIAELPPPDAAELSPRPERSSER